MSEPHIVSTLRRKRAEIGGYVHDLERQVKRQRAALAHIDATIRLFFLLACLAALELEGVSLEDI